MWVPKDVIALTSQCLAAADNMLHCFSLLPAESAGWIHIRHVIYRCPLTGPCPMKIATAVFIWCLLEQVINSFLTWSVYKKLTMSMTWQISPGTMILPYSTHSITLCLLQRSKGPLLKLFLCLLVQQSASQIHYSTDEPTPRSSR
jgi:hypothetical protein